MSKEKLKEIKIKHKNTTTGGLILVSEDVEELMKLAYNQALEDAVDIAEVKYITILKGKNEYEIKAVVNKESILKLKI